MRVLRTQVPDSHDQIFKYTSPLALSCPSRESKVANHLPESETIACSTRDGSRALSSRLETLFEGETSSSERSLEVAGA